MTPIRLRLRVPCCAYVYCPSPCRLRVCLWTVVEWRGGCRQLQQLRVALGWGERLSMTSSFVVLDVGLHTPKAALPRCLHVRRIGRYNTEKALTPRPVQYYTTANVFHAYTRDLRVRSLYFDMQQEREWASSFFTAPGSVEAMLGRYTRHIVSVRVSGEWLALGGASSRRPGRPDGSRSMPMLRGRTVDRGSGSRDADLEIHYRKRFFHVRLPRSLLSVTSCSATRPHVLCCLMRFCNAICCSGLRRT